MLETKSKGKDVFVSNGPVVERRLALDRGMKRNKLTSEALYRSIFPASVLTPVSQFGVREVGKAHLHGGAIGQTSANCEISLCSSKYASSSSTVPSIGSVSVHKFARPASLMLKVIGGSGNVVPLHVREVREGPESFQNNDPSPCSRARSAFENVVASGGPRYGMNRKLNKSVFAILYVTRPYVPVSPVSLTNTETGRRLRPLMIVSTRLATLSVEES